MLLGACAADCVFAGKQHRLIQSCEFTAILHAHDAAHYWGGCSFVGNFERVSWLLCFILVHPHPFLDRITEVSYKVFFDAIEAQGRALLRIHLVS